MTKLKGVTFGNTDNGLEVTIDLSEIDGNFSISKLEDARNAHLVEVTDSLMDLNRPAKYEVNIIGETNEPELTIETAPETMTIKEIRDYNSIKTAINEIKAKIDNLFNSRPHLSEEEMTTVLKREYPNFTDNDIRNIFAMEYDLIDSYSDKIQNVASIADLVNATKKGKYVFA